MLIVATGCEIPERAKDLPPQIAQPKVVSTTQPEDDAVVPQYQEPQLNSKPSDRNARSRSSVVTTTPAATTGLVADDQKSSEGRPELTAQDGSADKNDQSQVAKADEPRRTSMPNRDQKDKKEKNIGGVRKAVPVDLSAAALFGKWKIDHAKTTVDYFRADFVLFLADGRMRIWRGGGVEDGRWTWNKDEGVKTGGLDGVSFALGSFESKDGEFVITGADDRMVVLVPSRVFVPPQPTPKVGQPPIGASR